MRATDTRSHEVAHLAQTSDIWTLPTMLKNVKVKNYKSIANQDIELGRFNVFIGENGCGKTNILESVAMLGAAITGKLSVEDLFARGIRVSEHSTTVSAFSGIKPNGFSIGCSTILSRIPSDIEYRFRPSKDASIQWTARRSSIVSSTQLKAWQSDRKRFNKKIGIFAEAFATAKRDGKNVTFGVPAHLFTRDEVNALMRLLTDSASKEFAGYDLAEFAIYNASASALRGLNTVSRRLPLGINGESLDVALSRLSPSTRRDIEKRIRCVSWLDAVKVADTPKTTLSRGKSKLVFLDRFMPTRSRRLSAETVNEGVLHALFNLVLVGSHETPRVLGIDNLESALNPQLCRDLVVQLVELSRMHDKQVLATTHNPALLDGLNLNDDEQRLFVVYRNDAGRTVAKRIKMKPKVPGLKLSELWMRGHLGGIPRNF